MNRDALINDYIRLKDRPAAPVERWQMLPTIRRSASAKNISAQNITAQTLPSSPLKQITNTAFPQTPKTPQSHKLIVKAKSSKKKQRRRSKSLDNSTIATPGLHNSTRVSQRTPGRNGGTPGGCRFIPNE